jgi:hypothetical protein
MSIKVNKKDRKKLSRELIVKAAVIIADTDGIESLSMRKVAQSLHVEAMSLYHHVSSKDDLVASMVEYIAPEICPPNADIMWQDAMRKRAHVVKAVLEKHPWAAHLFISGFNDGPRMMKYSDSTIGYLLQAGFGTKLTDYAWNIIDSYIYGFNMQRQDFPINLSEYKKVAKEYLPYLSETELPHARTMTMSIIDGSHDGIQDFDFGLNIILEGLEKERLKHVSKSNKVEEKNQ